MSEDGFSSLTGAWTGVYDYDGPDDPVAFTASLTETDRAIAGEIAEPNTFSPAAVDCLLAAVSGRRDDDRVAFTKRYEGLPAADHSVEYEGVADARRTKIEGRWRIPGFAGFPSASGGFVMNRSGGAARDAAAETERHVVPQPR